MYAIYGNIYHQYTPFMLAYIPAPWILWVCYPPIFRDTGDTLHKPNCGSQGPHFPTIHIGRMGEVKVKCSWLSRVKSTSQSADALLPLRLAQRSKNVQKNHPTQPTSFMIPMLFHCFKSMKKSDWPYFHSDFTYIEDFWSDDFCPGTERHNFHLTGLHRDGSRSDLNPMEGKKT